MVEKTSNVFYGIISVAFIFSIIIWPIICWIYIVKISEIYISSGLIGKMIEVYVALMSILFIAHSLLLAPKPLTDIQRRQEEFLSSPAEYQKKLIKDVLLNNFVYLCFILSLYLLVLNVFLYFVSHSGNLIFYELVSWITISPLFGYFLLLSLTIHIFHAELLKSRYFTP